MILKFADKKIDVREEYIKSTISKSTGKELNTYRFTIKVVGKEKFAEFNKLMKQYNEKIVYQVDENDNILARYNVGTWNYRYYNEFDVEEESYLCNIEIIQVEELVSQTIIIEGIENEVIKYKEEYDDHNKAIVIRAIIKNTEEKRQAIYEAIKDKKYFEVVRPDINSNVLKMRFGKTTWSEHEGYIKRNIVLVEEEYDINSKIKNPFFWPELPNIMTLLSKNIIYVEKLEGILEENNLMNKDDIIKIKKQADEEYNNVYRQFYKVEDAEDDFE